MEIFIFAPKDEAKDIVSKTNIPYQQGDAGGGTLTGTEDGNFRTQKSRMIYKIFTFLLLSLWLFEQGFLLSGWGNVSRQLNYRAFEIKLSR